MAPQRSCFEKWCHFGRWSHFFPYQSCSGTKIVPQEELSYGQPNSSVLAPLFFSVKKSGGGPRGSVYHAAVKIVLHQSTFTYYRD